MHHDKRYPGEDGAYRRARDRLLQAEIELDAKVQEVASLRRELPVGGMVVNDYVFEKLVGDDVREVRLSELFPPGKSTLMLYSFMYSDAMEAACPACTSLIDGLSGIQGHLADRMGFAVVAKSPIGRLAGLAEERGWGDVLLLSSAGNTYNRDYYAETPEGNQIPAANVFVRRDDGIHHFWGAEMLYVNKPGHPRHVDQFWPVWQLMDLTPEGRGTDWFPKLQY